MIVLIVFPAVSTHSSIIVCPCSVHQFGHHPAVVRIENHNRERIMWTSSLFFFWQPRADGKLELKNKAHHVQYSQLVSAIAQHRLESPTVPVSYKRALCKVSSPFFYSDDLTGIYSTTTCPPLPPLPSPPTSLMRFLSSRGPWKRTARRLGQNLSISDIPESWQSQSGTRKQNRQHANLLHYMTSYHVILYLLPSHDSACSSLFAVVVNTPPLSIFIHPHSRE